MGAAASLDRRSRRRLSGFPNGTRSRARRSRRTRRISAREARPREPRGGRVSALGRRGVGRGAARQVPQQARGGRCRARHGATTTTTTPRTTRPGRRLAAPPPPRAGPKPRTAAEERAALAKATREAAHEAARDGAAAASALAQQARPRARRPRARARSPRPRSRAPLSRARARVAAARAPPEMNVVERLAATKMVEMQLFTEAEVQGLYRAFARARGPTRGASRRSRTPRRRRPLDVRRRRPAAAVRRRRLPHAATPARGRRARGPRARARARVHGVRARVLDALHVRARDARVRAHGLGRERLLTRAQVAEAVRRVYASHHAGATVAEARNRPVDAKVTQIMAGLDTGSSGRAGLITRHDFVALSQVRSRALPSRPLAPRGGS